jgi:hypothetical protein
MTNEPGDSAPGNQILTYVQHHENQVTVGWWLFACGGVAFVCFGAFLRDRLQRYEGGTGIASSLAYAGTLGVAVASFGLAGPKISLALDADTISASTASALFASTNAFFLGAELMMILPTAAVAVIAFRTGVLARWWAVVSAIMAVTLVIGPIGWAALIFGTPIWTLVTGAMLGLRRTRSAPMPAVATPPSHDGGRERARCRVPGTAPVAMRSRSPVPAASRC